MWCAPCEAKAKARRAEAYKNVYWKAPKEIGSAMGSVPSVEPSGVKTTDSNEKFYEFKNKLLNSQAIKNGT